MYFVSALLLGLFLFLFNQSATVYRYASMVARTTMEAVENVGLARIFIL
jgi:hypothetical protein